MASQREWESVVWHFLGDRLKNSDHEEVKDWIYGFAPSTSTQDERWEKAIDKVQQQLERFAGDEVCSESCPGNIS